MDTVFPAGNEAFPVLRVSHEEGKAIFQSFAPYAGLFEGQSLGGMGRQRFADHAQNGE